ncbi:MAG: C69 family dipeptidase [Acidimicrobiales bacterium]
MCDTLCALRPNGTLFAKNSDRPPTEVQLIGSHPARSPGGCLSTQYLDIPDVGAVASVLARPDWLWGAEHGVNEHGVAIGNEKIYTAADPYAEPPALIGMDLVRLGLERSHSADEALDVITGLLGQYGQGGVADSVSNEPYFSSFLLADASSGWILETSGRTWAARPVKDHAAISNRLCLGQDWTQASPDVHGDFDAWRNPEAPTGHADIRLASGEAYLSGDHLPTPASMVAHLRNHGDGSLAPPPYALPDGTGVTVCMHVRGYQATTSSMVAWLPTEGPVRAWMAPGSPCVSVFVPVFPPAAVPGQLGQVELWKAFARLRDRVEADSDTIGAVRAELDPIEQELWEQADDLVERPNAWTAFAEQAGRRVAEAAARLA